MESDTDLAAAIWHSAALEGDFKLRSGLRSSRYFDKYQFESDPVLLRRIAAEMARMLPPRVDALAGLELGGVPIATALSLESGIPVAFVRKSAKSYGTCRLAEGPELSGRSVVVVEDVVSSGGQIVQSSRALQETGAVIRVALCVIDREGGGREALAELGIELRPLFRSRDLELAGNGGGAL